MELLQQTLAGYALPLPDGQDVANAKPTDEDLFDLIEFTFENVAHASDPSDHSYFGHCHYDYDRDAGRARFEEDVNCIFERRGIAFKLERGEVVRIAPGVAQGAIAAALYRTGDQDLDRLLEDSRNRYSNRNLEERKIGLEKLWDAWERLKTIEQPRGDKAQGTARLLDRTASGRLREVIEQESRALTQIGNSFMIRHTEVNKTPLTSSEHVDYFYHRLFSLIRLILVATARGG
jgi:hypothetical protein